MPLILCAVNVNTPTLARNLEDVAKAYLPKKTLEKAPPVFSRTGSTYTGFCFRLAFGD